MTKQTIINLGAIEDIPLGQGRCFIVQNDEIAVFRSRSQAIFAIENRCPHRRGLLAEGIMGNDKVVCPLHGHKFDLATGKGSEGMECVRTFKVWQENGQILLEYPIAINVEKKCEDHYAEIVLSANSKIYYREERK